MFTCIHFTLLHHILMGYYILYTFYNQKKAQVISLRENWFHVNI
jgi:hypothetical protein